MNVIWSTLGKKGNLNFTPEIEWTEAKLSCDQIISIHSFDRPINSTGKGNSSILHKTLEYLKVQKDGNYFLLTYLTDQDLIHQIFAKIDSIKPSIPKFSQRNPILFVLNPFGGTRAASKLYNRLIQPLIKISCLPYELIETSHAKHATSIAHNLDFDKYSGIVTISGDGVFHEIINGLLTRKDWSTVRNTPIGIIGAGSGNAMSQNLNLNSPERAFLAILNGKTTPLDIFSYYQPNHGISFSHLSVVWGLIADLDTESEAYRWLGSERFTVAALIRLIKFRTYTGTLYILPIESSNSSLDSKDINEISSIPTDYHSWPIRVQGDFKLFIGSNYSWLSKDFKVSSESLNSGSIQLIWSNKLSTFQGLSILLNPNNGEWINRPEISNIRAKSFVLGILHL